MRLLLLIASIICFVLGALSIAATSMLYVGLALLAGSFLPLPKSVE